MAGNTKLIGFDAVGGKGLKLERWGSSCIAEVSEESLEAIRKACAEDLPLKPLPHRTSVFELGVNYDSMFGQAVMRMSPDVLKRFIGFLREDSEKTAEFLKHHFVELIEELEQALEDHRNFTDLDEPGL